MVVTARLRNPQICILARTHSDEESALLSKSGVDEVLMGEDTLARAMAANALAATKAQ